MDQSARDEARRKAQKWLVEEAQKTPRWMRLLGQTSARRFRKREMGLLARVFLGSLALFAMTLVLTLAVGPDRPTNEPPLTETPTTGSQESRASPSNATPRDPTASSDLTATDPPAALAPTEGSSQWPSLLAFARAYATRETGLIIPVGFLTAFWVASYYVHWRQGRETVFKLVEELLSHGFEETRFELITLAARKAAEGQDLANLSSWLPYPRASIEPGTVDIKAFAKDHALSRMVYFVYRAALYAEDGLINEPLFRKTFHSFFAHYELVLLEFAEAYRRYVKEQQILDARWLALPDGIERFFRLVGCAGRLPPGHVFTYFPSLNPKIHSD